MPLPSIFKLYGDIGKETRDLLHSNYQTDFKLLISSKSGRALTFFGSKASSSFVARMINKSKELTTDLRVDNNSKVFVGFTADLTPGLKAVFSLTEPQSSCKAELHYQNEYVGISTNIGVSYKPIMNFSGVLGNNYLSLGSDISYNSASGNLTEFNAAFSFTFSDLVASVILKDFGRTLHTSYYHALKPTAAIGVECNWDLSTYQNSVAVGVQIPVGDSILIKACVNNNGQIKALIQQDWPTTCVRLHGEHDGRVGLSLAMKLNSTVEHVRPAQALFGAVVSLFE